MSDTIRVLLVDDEEQFVVNMARILGFRGLKVSYALNGADALGMMERGIEFDVVVLDVKMPGMDGITVLGEIKRRAPETEVIMLTGHATLSSGTEAMRRGAFDYLMKPCDTEDLVEKIKEAHETEVMKRHPVLWPRKMVRDIPLHALEGLHPDDSLDRAVEMLKRKPGRPVFERVFILDREDRVLGVVWRRDLLDQGKETQKKDDVTWDELLKHPEWLPPRNLGEIMTHNPPSTQSNALLTDAAGQMFVNNIRRLPVIRAGRTIGIIHMQDVFQYLDGEME